MQRAGFCACKMPFLLNCQSSMQTRDPPFGPLLRSYMVSVHGQYTRDPMEANKVPVDHAQRRKAKVPCHQPLVLTRSKRAIANASILCMNGVHICRERGREGGRERGRAGPRECMRYAIARRVHKSSHGSQVVEVVARSEHPLFRTTSTVFFLEFTSHVHRYKMRNVGIV